MKYKICHIILFLATVGMALSISVAEASEEPVIIGVPLPLSGNLQEFGMMMKNSFEVASDALKRTTSFSPKNIREALNRTYIITPFAPVKFYAYEEFERQNSINPLVLQSINGKFETVWPPELASTPFILPDRN